MPSAWDTEQDFRLVMALMMTSNKNLEFSDWKGASDIVERVFKGEKKVNAIRQRWAKIREAFLKTLQEDGKNENAKGKHSGTTAPKRKAGRKRPAAAATPPSGTNDAEEDDADAHGSDNVPSAKKARHALAKSQ